MKGQQARQFSLGAAGQRQVAALERRGRKMRGIEEIRTAQMLVPCSDAGIDGDGADIDGRGSALRRAYGDGQFSVEGIEAAFGGGDDEVSDGELDTAMRLVQDVVIFGGGACR